MNPPGDGHKIEEPIEAGEQLAPAAVAPDWQAMAEEVRCPLCEYNLRGLTQPRCPECGYSFKWEEILDEKRRHHRYIFEHHPERNFWSFMRTFLGGLRPKKFWSELHPLQDSRPKRLALYRMIVLVLVVIPVLIDDFWQPPQPMGTPRRVFFSYSTHRRQLAWQARLNYPWNFFVKPLDATGRELLWSLMIISVALPVTYYALLMIFQQTMRKAKVRRDHVGRCISYSADIVLWPILPLCVLTLLNGAAGSPNQWEEEIAWTVLISIVLIWLIFAWRLVFAYRYYLRFDHAVGTIFSVQLIIFLLVLLIS